MALLVGADTYQADSVKGSFAGILRRRAAEGNYAGVLRLKMVVQLQIGLDQRRSSARLHQFIRRRSGRSVALDDEGFIVDFFQLTYCLIDILPAVRRQHFFPALIRSEKRPGIYPLAALRQGLENLPGAILLNRQIVKVVVAAVFEEAFEEEFVLQRFRVVGQVA